jgi:flagellar basal body-associated protein FliL
MRKTLIFIVILAVIVAAIFALVLVVPILHIGKVKTPNQVVTRTPPRSK